MSPKKITIKKWHASLSQKILGEYRMSVLMCLMLCIVGILYAVLGVGAQNASIGVQFEVTDGTSSSSSTRSSSSSSAPVIATTTFSRTSQNITDAQNRRPRVDIYHNAPEHRYSDIPPGAWYEESVNTFLQLGILDATKSDFRPGDSALRAELAKVLGEFHGGVPKTPSYPLQFDDLVQDAWYVPFVEFAGKNGWMRGYGNCIGTHPCNVMPGATITRAEAVTMLIRFYALTPTNTAPSFTDVHPDAWYAKNMAIAADHCIIQGVNGSKRAAPNHLLHRAEMIAMLDRARQNLAYSIDCGEEAVSSAISSSETSSAFSSQTSMTTSSLQPSSLHHSIRLRSTVVSFAQNIMGFLYDMSAQLVYLSTVRD
jgi:hypothetical protein